MSAIASQITSLTIVYSIVYSDADQRKHQSSASLAFVWGIHRDRWIPRTNGQLRGKCFHLMTSSCRDNTLYILPVSLEESCVWRIRRKRVKIQPQYLLSYERLALITGVPPTSLLICMNNPFWRLTHLLTLIHAFAQVLKCYHELFLGTK